MPGQPQLFPNHETRNQQPELQRPDLQQQDRDSLLLPDPHLHDPDKRDSGQHPADSSGSQLTTRTAPVWLQRTSLFVLVLFCVYLGVLVMVLPWWPRIWDHNMFFEAHPSLSAFVHNGAVRGVISGVGLLDIWIGISEAVHYRDYRG
jgi:hypothetical protein